MRTLPTAVQAHLDAGLAYIERNFIWITAADASTYGFWDGARSEAVSVVRPSDGAIVSRSYYGGRGLVVPANEDQAALVVRSLSFGLSGASSTVTGMLAASDLRNAAFEWHKGFADPATGVLLAEPECEFEGSIDGLRRIEAGSELFSGGAASDVIEIACTSHARELTRTSGLTRSYRHGLERSGDEFYRYCGSVGRWKIRWGAGKMSHADKGGGGKKNRDNEPNFNWGEHS